MGRFRSLLVRRTVSNHGLAADQSGSITGLGLLDGSINRHRIVTIHIRDHLPAIRLKPLRSVISKPAMNFTINGNTVVIIKSNQLVELERTG